MIWKYVCNAEFEVLYEMCNLSDNSGNRFFSMSDIY